MELVKFRGICNVAVNPHLFGAWIYGGIKFKKIKGVRMCFICDENSGGDYSVYPETVGQFTGLQDKNSVDVYEGDILRITSERGYSEVGQIWYKKITARFGFLNKDDEFYGIATKDKSNEVIGNIHENKELLTFKN